MPSSLSEDYPPPLPRPQVLLVTTRVVYTHKPSTVNNVASKKNLYYKIFAVLFTLSVVFHSGDYKYFVYLVSLFDPKLRIDLQLFILFKYKNLQKIDEAI